MPKLAPKLPGSTVAEPLKFEETEGFWASVEKHSGPLKQKRRERLRYIINSYFARAQFEVNATDLALADKRLADIRKTAAAFWKVLMADPTGDGAIEAHNYVEHVLDSILRQSMRLSVFLGPPVVPDSQIRKPPQPLPKSPMCWSTPRLVALAVPDHVSESAEFVDLSYISQRLRPLETRRVREVLSEYVSACRLAGCSPNASGGKGKGRTDAPDASDEAKNLGKLEKTRDAKHYQAGEAWEMFVLRLGRFWSGLGRKTSATKDYIKAPSPFVVFVSTVQNHFPSRFRRHTKSLEALSLKISRVLAKSRRQKRVAKRKQGDG
jgi:hypothetical protein